MPKIVIRDHVRYQADKMAKIALGATPRAHLDADAHLERRVREALIPLGHLAVVVGAHADGTRAIERGQQRHAAHRGVVRGQRAHAGLDALVGHDRRHDVTRVLEPRHEERQRALAALAVANVDLSESVARDLARHAIVIAQRSRPPRPHARDQRVERALAAVVAGGARARHDLQRPKVRLLQQEVDNECPEGLRLGRAAHSPFQRFFVHGRSTNEPLFGYTEISRPGVRNAHCGFTERFSGNAVDFAARSPDQSGA